MKNSLRTTAMRRLQQGFGLVEAMVALAIGMILALGLAEIFSAMHQTSVSTQQLSAVQNEQRMALYFLETAVTNAGYYPNPTTTSPDAQFPAANYTSPAAGSFVAAQTLTGSGSGSPASGNDVISVRFTADSNGADQGCSSSLIAGHVYTDSFTYSFTAPNGYLTCYETDNTAGGATVAINLIPQLAGMNVLYGVDSTGAGNVTQYVSANHVTSWSNVRTVQVTLQFPNPFAGQTGQPATVQVMEAIPFMVNLT